MVFEGIAAPESRELLQCMLECLRRGSYCVVEEIAFCINECRESISALLRVEVPGVEVEWMCFENDIDSANWNVRNRTNKGSAEGHTAINREYHPRYTYPPGAKVEPIVRTEALMPNSSRFGKAEPRRKPKKSKGLTASAVPRRG